MDFEKMKARAKELSTQAQKKVNIGLEKAGKLVAESEATLKTQAELDAFLQANKKACVLFGDKNTDFFKHALYRYPVFSVKSWVSGYRFKLAYEELEVKNIRSYPALVIFDGGAVKSSVSGEDNIEKVLKNLDADIEKSIDKI